MPQENHGTPSIKVCGGCPKNRRTSRPCFGPPLMSLLSWVDKSTIITIIAIVAIRCRYWPAIVPYHLIIHHENFVLSVFSSYSCGPSFAGVGGGPIDLGLAAVARPTGNLEG